MENFLRKLNEIKKEVEKINQRDPYNQLLERVSSLVEKFLGSDSKFIGKLKKLQVVTPYNSLDTGAQKALQIEIDAIADEIEFLGHQQPKITTTKLATITNKIELSTRRNILDAFIVTKIRWYGNIEQTDFLGRLFDLSKLPSNDHRYTTAAEDIHKHTSLNNDWTDEWVFTDSRFNLLHTQDNLFLDFLSLTIHPTVRDNNEQVVTLLEIYNNNLAKDGYELFQTGEIASRPIFRARERQAVATAKAKPHDERKLALVIGCSDYTYAGILANPLNDANSIEEKLKNLGFEVMKILNPNQRDLKKAIDDFGETLKGYDTGLFYFAGHGVQVKGINYLLPVDANLKTEKMVEYDCVEANRVLAYMEESKSQVNIVILDACRDNPFERSWGRGISLRGLTTMSAPSGSLIAYATSPGKTASDGSAGNGLYTYSLLEHIGSKQLSIMTMFQNVRKDVMTKSKSEQIPWEATSLTADYFFNP